MFDDIRSMTTDEIENELREFDLPKWRTNQIYGWFRRGAESFDEMTNLPRLLREKLRDTYPISPIELSERHVSKDGTAKYLWRISGGDRIESVLMKYRHGVSVCVSSQAGCRMGCRFCASAGAGFTRNLLPSEMEDEVRLSAKNSNVRASGIVLMGIGEPLDNMSAVLRFIKLVSDPEGLGIGARHISLSTCGGVPGAIDRLAELKLGITLSISLHAPVDSVREKLMPISKNCGVSELAAQCRRYFEATGRRISYEYALIDGVNDSPEMATKLAELLKTAPGHVNLITLNKTSNSNFCPSSKENLERFSSQLTTLGVNVTKRRKLGADIDAACGQLRTSKVKSGGIT